MRLGLTGAEVWMDGHATLQPLEAVPEAPQAGRGPRVALRVLQAGVLAVVLVASTWKAFELDRFFVPKELVLHATALLAGLLLLGTLRRDRGDRVDGVLAVVLLLSLASAALATNPWLGARATAITASGVLLFLVARAVSRGGLERPLLAAVALAVVAAAATALLQTYGVRTEFFSLNRAPGGTLGNRNFVAHLAAFGLPVVLLVALRARGAGGWLVGAAGAALVTASLILTRSRAGWLAFAAVLLVLAFALVASPALRRQGRTWLRLAGIVLLAAAGVAAALALPNTLRWRSDNPYLESMRGVANYQEGSGRGRLIQYQRSVVMTSRHPLLGVGPGNWAVEYPRHAAPRDPSLDRSAAGMTSNPWPSSDWIAFVSERGPFAALLLALVFVAAGVRALRRLRAAPDAEDALRAAALLATVAATLVTGAFDAVLLLAVPTFIVWTVLGALWLPGTTAAAGGFAERASRWRTLGVAALVLLVFAGSVRSAAQLTAIGLHASGDAALMRRAARIDPGNYRIHLHLARTAPRAERCRHASAAHALFPQAQAARNLARRCD